MNKNNENYDLSAEYWEDKYSTLNDLLQSSPEVFLDYDLLRLIEKDRAKFNKEFDNLPILFVTSPSRMIDYNNTMNLNYMYVDINDFIKAINGEDVKIPLFENYDYLYMIEVCIVLKDLDKEYTDEEIDNIYKLATKYINGLVGKSISKYNHYYLYDNEITVGEIKVAITK